mgnify:CR=1 FL=1
MKEPVAMKSSTDPRQRQLPFDEAYTRARESRQERCQRLLEGLGQPASKINTAARFDFDKAIARGRHPPMVVGTTSQ